MSKKMRKVIAIMIIAIQIITSHGVSIYADGLATVKNSEEVVVNEDEATVEEENFVEVEDEEGARETRPYEGEDEESEEDEEGARETGPYEGEDEESIEDEEGARETRPYEGEDDESEEDEEGARETRPYESEDEEESEEKPAEAVEVEEDDNNIEENLLGDTDTVNLTLNGWSKVYIYGTEYDSHSESRIGYFDIDKYKLELNGIESGTILSDIEGYKEPQDKNNEYDFIGWTKKQNLNRSASEYVDLELIDATTYEVNNSETLYAVFENKDVTLIFEADSKYPFPSGNDSFEFTTKSLDFGVYINLNDIDVYEEPIVPDTHEFLGWRKKDTEDTVGLKGIESFRPKESCTYVPIVENIKYTIEFFSPFEEAFDGNNVKKVVKAKNTIMSDIDEFNTTFDNVKDYNFSGWYKVYGYTAEGIESLFKSGNKITNSKPGLDVYFKHIQADAFGLIETSHTADRVDAEDALKENMFLISVFTSKVTFDAGDGKFSNGESKYYVDGIRPRITKIGSLEYETPVSNDEDYEFVNWRLESEDGEVVPDSFVIDGNITLVAHYGAAKDKVRVTFDAGEGEITSGDEVVEVMPGTDFSKVAKPTVQRLGYDFDGWYLEKDPYKNKVQDTSIIDKETTLYAKWSIKQYIVSFCYEMGTQRIPAMPNYYIYVNHGAKIKEAQNFSSVADYFNFEKDNNPIEGYKIVALKKVKGKEIGDDVTADTVIDSQIVVLMILKGNDLTIKFDANEGILDGEDEISVAYGTKFSEIEVPTVTKEDGFFVNWKTSSGEDVTGDYVFTKNDTLIATWSYDTVKIVFNAGEGKFSDGSNIKTWENAPKGIIIKNLNGLETPTLENMDFDTWTSGDKSYSDESKITEDIELTAKYKDGLVSLKINMNGKGILEGKGMTVKGATATIWDIKKGTLLKDVLKDYSIRGYEGWTLTGYTDQGELVDVNTKALTENTSLVAVFNGESFTVTIDANGGMFDDGSTIKVFNDVYVDTVIDKIAGYVAPKRSNYSISGYSTDKDSRKLTLKKTVTSGDPLYVIWAETKGNSVNPTRKETSSPGGGNNGGSSAGPIAPSPQGNSTQTEGAMSAFANMAQPGDTNTQQAQPTTTYQQVSEVAVAEANTQVNAVLAAFTGLVDANAVNSESMKQVANEVAAGLDLKQTIESIVNQVQTNTLVNTVANVSQSSISANNAKWTADANGNISLTKADTNEKVVDTWQSVANSDGLSVGWYKFDGNGNMQTGLVTDNGNIYYLKETQDSTFGQMAKNETVVVGGLVMTFNNDGALVNMDYSAEKVAEKVYSAATAQATATQVANQATQVTNQPVVTSEPIGPHMML